MIKYSMSQTGFASLFFVFYFIDVEIARTLYGKFCNDFFETYIHLYDFFFNLNFY